MNGSPVLTPLNGTITLNVALLKLLVAVTVKLKHASWRFPGTPACLALEVVDDQWPLSTLVGRARTFPSTVRTTQADNFHPSPECSLQVQSFSESSRLEPPPPLSDEKLLSDLNWINHSASNVFSQVHVFHAPSEQSVIHNDDATNFPSLLQDYKDVFDETSTYNVRWPLQEQPDATPYAQLSTKSPKSSYPLSGKVAQWDGTTWCNLSLWIAKSLVPPNCNYQYSSRGTCILLQIRCSSWLLATSTCSWVSSSNLLHYTLWSPCV